MSRRDDPKDSVHGDEGKRSKRRIGRRDFVKLVGGTGVAVTAEVLARQQLATAATTTQETVVGGGKVIGPGPVPVTLRINGEAKKLTVEPRVTLLDALRNHLDLTGAKKVCDRGTCGACTVIVNGKATYSCTALAIDVADHDGKPGADIRTIEGLAPAGEGLAPEGAAAGAGEGALAPLQRAFVEHDALQCGFCTPGMVMACAALLEANPRPTLDEVKHALAGNLCRCGTYPKVFEAVFAAAAKR